MGVAPEPFTTVFTPIPFVSPANLTERLVRDAHRDQLVRQLCAAINAKYQSLKWNEDACAKVAWKADMTSRAGSPLLYAEFGEGKTGTTLLLGGVHPDELTPVPIAFRAARYFAEHPELLAEGGRVIVAPLVNPDGFLRPKPTRTNGNGIDLNRNFFTMDWYEKAKKLWVTQRSQMASHFPGYFPNSEVETLFQIQLIDRYHPDKILSIHAPLGFLDYDGPGDGRPKMLTTTQVRAKRLVTAISEKSRNYRVVDYTFYPGSLGNFAGQERHIPTVTLELETTEPSKLETYWDQFLPGIMQAVRYPFLSQKELDAGSSTDASPFSALYSLEPNKTI
jgi:protein MpaA